MPIHQAPAADDEKARGLRLLLLGKGAVLRTAWRHALAAGLDESEQPPGVRGANVLAAPFQRMWALGRYAGRARLGRPPRVRRMIRRRLLRPDGAGVRGGRSSAAGGRPRRLHRACRRRARLARAFEAGQSRVQVDRWRCGRGQVRLPAASGGHGAGASTSRLPGSRSPTAAPALARRASAVRVRA